MVKHRGNMINGGRTIALTCWYYMYAWVGSMVIYIHECIATRCPVKSIHGDNSALLLLESARIPDDLEYSHSQLHNSPWPSLSNFLPHSYLHVVCVAWLLVYSVSLVVRLSHNSSYLACWHQNGNHIYDIAFVMSSHILHILLLLAPIIFIRPRGENLPPCTGSATGPIGHPRL